MAKPRNWPVVVRVVNTSKGTVIANHVGVATSMWARGRGLMLRPSLPGDTGLLIDPCSSIHSMWMRFPIDVLYLNDDDVVVRLADAMPAWRIGPLRTGARYVVELPAGAIASSLTTPGDQIEYEPPART